MSPRLNDVGVSSPSSVKPSTTFAPTFASLPSDVWTATFAAGPIAAQPSPETANADGLKVGQPVLAIAIGADRFNNRR